MAAKYSATVQMRCTVTGETAAQIVIGMTAPDEVEAIYAAAWAARAACEDLDIADVVVAGVLLEPVLEGDPLPGFSLN